MKYDYVTEQQDAEVIGGNMNLNEARMLEQTLNYRRNDLQSIRRDAGGAADVVYRNKTLSHPAWCDPKQVDAMIVSLEQAILILKQAEEQEMAKITIKVKLDLNKLLAPIE